MFNKIFLAWVALLVVALATAQSAHPACNLIPGAQRTFRSVEGTTDHAFASPGDPVELSLEPVCEATASCFPPTPEATVVTVVFKPIAGGVANVAVMARDCSSLAAARAACEARGDVATAACIEAGPEDIDVRDARRLRFVFPDTDDQLGLPADDVTWSGPAAIAVTATTDVDPLPCALASSSCSDLAGSTRACVDAIFAGPSASAGFVLDDAFRGFTALPPPNDFQAVCSEPSPPCTGRADALRFALDAEGNLLIPVDWRGVLVNRAGVPVARLLQGTSSIDAFAGGGEPIRVPGRAFVGSYSPEGGKLPPIFDPQAERDPATEVALSLFGSADAPRSVLRLARRSVARTECDGGPNDGTPCFADGDCLAPLGDGAIDGACVPSTCRTAIGGDTGVACASDSDCAAGTECGPALFDFRSRLVAPTGPLVLRSKRCLGGGRDGQSCSADAQCPAGQCGGFDLDARDPVPLDGLSQSDVLSAFVVDERIEDQDLNGDRDREDDVVLLASRQSGAIAAIGESGRKGRAVVRVRQPPFSFPALAIDGGVVAFLESEPLQAGRDANRDGDVADTVLRVFRADGSELIVQPGAVRTVDPAPLIDGRSLAFIDGAVVYRRSEAAAGPRTTERIGRPRSEMPALSADGRLIAFRSTAASLVPGDGNLRDDIFVFDRATDDTQRVSVASDGSEGSGPCDFATPEFCRFNSYAGLSGDGRVAVYRSSFDGLDVDDKNDADDVFLHDLASGETVAISKGPGGVPGDADSFTPSVDDTGTRIVFSSVATNLLPPGAPTPDTNFVCEPDGEGNCEDVFVHDRSSGENLLVSVGNAGQQGNNHSYAFARSVPGDGRRVAFMSLATNLIDGGDRNGATGDVFVRDLESGTTELVHVGVDGEQGNLEANFPSISANGRFVAFQASSTNLVAGDTNGATDVFVRDLVAGTTERVSVSASGEQANGSSRIPALSGDGRFVAFVSEASNLVAGDTNRARDVFVHDRLTGTTERASVSSNGRPGNDDSGNDSFIAISADGRFVAFTSLASTLVAGPPSDGLEDVFVRGVVDDLAAADLFRDGTLDDDVLEVMRVGGAGSPEVVTLCPATSASVAGGRVAYLRPEAEPDPTRPTPDCPKGSLNGDSDSDDLVAQLWSGGARSVSLERAATAISLSEDYLAALVPEAGQGDGSLNGDGDGADLIAEVYHPLPDGQWHSTSLAAEEIAARGAVVAFLASEPRQGEDLDGDGDAFDHVLQLYDPERSPPVRDYPAQPAEDFVIGPTGIVAFRTREAALCAGNSDPASFCPAPGVPAGCTVGTCDRNGDGDCCDDVLQVYDFVEKRLLPAVASVVPCRFEACDPRVPYRVRENTVTFLTLESDEGCTGGIDCFDGARDLNGDLDADDLVLQVFNVRGAASALAQTGASRLSAGAAAAAIAPTVEPLSAVSAGVCTSSGRACVDDADCGADENQAPGRCFVPPGGCIANLGEACTPPDAGRCSDPDAFCEPILSSPGQGRCKKAVGPCGTDADCPSGPETTCNETGQKLQRLVGPLASSAAGGEVFTSAGRCLSTEAGSPCSGASDCGPGEQCDGTAGEKRCRRDLGVCRAGGECPLGSSCRQELLIATANDADGDEIPDALDNCPSVVNPSQEDADGDQLGDACESAACAGGPCETRICGNGRVEPGEVCDDGNRLDGDGCDADCAGTACSAGSELTSARVVLARLGAPVGNETLTLTGSIDCTNAKEICDRVDPPRHGVQILIDSPGSGIAPLLDLTRRTAPIPPGAIGTQCEARDGWRGSSDGKSFIYNNRSGRLPAAGCTPGSAGGLRTLRVIDRRPVKDVIDVRIVVKDRALVAPPQPLAAKVVLDAGLEPGVNAACGSVWFAANACHVQSGSKSFICR